MRVKICGLQEASDALAAVEYGADIVGFVFAPSKRRIAPAKAARIIEVLPPFVSTVGVFVNEDPVVVEEIVGQCCLDYVQLHGDESPDYCRLFPGKVIKACRVSREIIAGVESQGYPSHVGSKTRIAGGDLEDYFTKNISPFLGIVRGILLDTFVEGAYGGTGKTIDIELAKNLTARIAQEAGRKVPVILAGGLDAGNVAEAIAAVQPWAVDVSSGVETDGRKDPQKIKDFLDNVRRCSYAE